MSLPESATRLQLWRYYSFDNPHEAFVKIAESYKNPEPNWCEFGDKDEKEIHVETMRFRNIGSKDEIVRAVYEWLQDSIVNFSYYGKPPEWLRDKKGKKVKEFKVNEKLRDALKRRSGYWRDIDCLFYRMLKDLGVEAWPTLTVSRKEHIFNEKAGFYQFERFVIAVKDSVGNYYYCSPGSYAIPFGSLLWVDEVSDALLCTENPIKVRMPASSPERNKAIRVFSLELINNVAVKGRMIERHSGNKGRLCCVNAIRDNLGYIKELLADSLSFLLPGVIGSIEDIKIDSSFKEPVEIQYSLIYNSTVPQNDTVLLIAPFLYAPDTGNVFTSLERNGEIVFNQAYHAIDSVLLLLTDKNSSMTLPSDTSVVTNAGYCRLTFSHDKEKVIAVRNFVLNKPRFSVDEYQDVRELFAGRAGLSHLTVAITPGD